MSNQLPSHIKPDSADAYNHAYTVLYCQQPRDIREMLDKAQGDSSYSTRETREFFKEVIRMAQFELGYEELKALERREKAEGTHISQMKRIEPVTPPPKIEEKPKSEPPTPPPSGENPS